MNVGEIYVWDTTQAIGHEVRRKYHVYLCEAGWRADGHAFLFISSANYGSDYQICSADYPFLVRNSFISCAGIVTYSDKEIAAANPMRVGVISKVHLSGLHRAIAGSETMVGWQIAMCCDALKKSLA